MSQSQIYFIYFFFLTHKQLNENPFKAYYTRNVHIQGASRNGGEKLERRARRKVRECVAFCCVAATQAKWHNERIVPIYASADCLSPTNDVFFCRKLPLFEWWEKYRRVRKEGAHLI